MRDFIGTVTSTDMLTYLAVMTIAGSRTARRIEGRTALSLYVGTMGIREEEIQVVGLGPTTPL